MIFAQKLFAFLIITVVFILGFLSFSSINLQVSASILEDFQKTFQNQKPKEEQINKPSIDFDQLEKQEQNENLTKICEIRKQYAISHFEDRQSTRTSEIDLKISSIKKIKTLLTNNKQDIAQLEPLELLLIRSLIQKKDLLSKRVQNINQINCKSQFLSWSQQLQSDNQTMASLDNVIASRSKVYGEEVRRIKDIFVQSLQPKPPAQTN